MRFKLDENLPAEAVEVLAAAGHDAVSVLDQSLGGAGDQELAAPCGDEGRVLVTFDTDFADIRSYPPGDRAGIIVFRLRSQQKFHVLRVMNRLIPILEIEGLDRQLWIVEEERIRIRE